MPSGMPEGAMCVQRFDDSLNSAIHITYRISLRSSSMREPRDPLLKVLTFCFLFVGLTAVWLQKSFFVGPPLSAGEGRTRGSNMVGVRRGFVKATRATTRQSPPANRAIVYLLAL
jgi:hypothetical protein